MDIIIGLVGFLIMLSIIVVVHELGHFLAAKKFGVYCHEFSVGMGPALYQKKGKETAFSIRAIPFGGYVMMAGENDGSADEDEEWMQNVPQDRRLNNKKTWQQIIVMAAGVTMNFIIAFLIFAGISVARGYVVEPAKPIVYEVVENSPAQKAGLQPDDKIIKVTNGTDTIAPATQFDVVEFVQFNPDNLTFTIERGDKTLDLNITPEKDGSNGYVIGYSAMATARKAGFFELVKAGWDNMIDSAASIFNSLGMLLKGKGLDQMSGPAGIAQVTVETTKMGFMAYMSLFALLSLNIGIFNLLPIPALDGGRIVILAVERLFKRKINQKLVENIIMASFILLIGLMLFATYNDILRIFS